MQQTHLAHSSGHEIPVRKPGLDLQAVPKYWLFNNIAATHFFNGLNLLFPDGERFFVKAVYDRLDSIDDPILRAQAKGFAGQEGQHANQHEKYFDVLRAHGYQIDGFLARFHTFIKLTNRWLPAPLRLSVTAAAEHFTATFGAGTLEDEDLLANMDPAMRKLIVWHAAEEIEHKAVAFDVLQRIDPSYALRVMGLLYATVTLGGFWLWGAITLLRQDGVSLRAALAELRAMRQRDPIIKRVFVRGIRQYLRRDFHPNQNDDRDLAAKWFAAHDLAMPEAA